MQWDEARTAAHALGTPLPATEVPLADALRPVPPYEHALRVGDQVWGALR